MTTLLLTAAALALDWIFGEPRRLHPLVGFGRLAARCERWLYGDAKLSPQARRARGLCALVLLLAPFTAVVAALAALPGFGLILSIAVLYFALGHRSLHDHARPVVVALRAGDEPEARHRASLMVSRDSAALDITRSATESVLENGNDAVFGTLFWFAVAGTPGALLYRLANTLDAMWGYRNDRYRDFGWAAARLDDVLNYLPARLTALTYALLGTTRQALWCWRSQAWAWESPNAGPVMAAGAGALGITIGGPARYAGEWRVRPVLGAGQLPVADHIERALKLVRHGVGLWLGTFMLAGPVHA
ncbi:MAG: adenosylcobinamide-phosphate synthase CbiB [Gammaproteobacteria bacterium]